MADRSSPHTLARELRDLWSTWCIMKMTAREMNARYLEWRDTWPKRVTVHARGFVDGVHDQLRNDVWSKVEFCYRAPDGTLYSTHKAGKASPRHKLTDDLYAAGKGCLLNNWDCAHLWQDSDRPYTEWKNAAAVGK